MRFITPVLAAAGVRAHPARQDLREPAGDPGQATGARRPARRWRARAAVAVTAIAVPLLAGAAPALTASAAPASTGHVYWANSAAGTIGRATLTGPIQHDLVATVNQSFITGDGSAFGVAIDAAHVYWANPTAGTIGRANLDGTGADPSFITGAGGAFGVAVDGAHVYWANPLAQTIGRANLDGHVVNQTFITGATFSSSGTGVAVDHTASP